MNAPASSHNLASYILDVLLVANHSILSLCCLMLSLSTMIAKAVQRLQSTQHATHNWHTKKA